MPSPHCTPWRAPHAAPSTTIMRSFTRTTSRPPSDPPRASSRPPRPPPPPPPLPPKRCGNKHRSSASSSNNNKYHSSSNTKEVERSVNAQKTRRAGRPAHLHPPQTATVQHRPSPPSLPPPPHAAAP